MWKCGATSFTTFILSTNGENILEKQGLNFIKPIVEGNVKKVPSAIRDMLEENEPIQLGPALASIYS